MNFKKSIQQNKDNITSFVEYDKVKIKGKLHYQNFVDEKWVFYIKKCIIRCIKHNVELENVKILLLRSNYRVPIGYETFEGVEGETPFVISPEIGDSDFPSPQYYAFGEYTKNNTRRRKYRTDIKRLMIIAKSKIYIINDCMLDLQI